MLSDSIFPPSFCRNKKPITLSFPTTSLNCEIHKPRVQEKEEETTEDEKLIIWWRCHGSFGPEKGEQGAAGAQAFITVAAGGRWRSVSATLNRFHSHLRAAAATAAAAVFD